MSDQLKMKRKLAIMGIKQKSTSVLIKCISCGETKEINTNNSDSYTEEVRSKYSCWKCKADNLPIREALIPVVTVGPIRVVCTNELTSPKPTVTDTETAKELTMEIRGDGVMRIAQRFISAYGFNGGDKVKVLITKDNIVITKECV